MASHFYHPTTGELIDGGLRNARKVNGLPSPTTVLSILKGEALIRYFRRQMWEAATTTPRLPTESDEEHFEACLKYADQHAKTAREKGGDFHDLVQRFHLAIIGEKDPPFIPPNFIDQFDVYSRWYETYVDKTLAVESTVIGQGYAVRLDHLALLKDGRVAVLDVKTQDVSKRNRFNYYSEWALQLGAYAGAIESIQHIDVLTSVVVSSSFPVVLEAHYWPKLPDHYYGLFLGLLHIWNEMHEYWPEPIPIEPLDSPVPKPEPYSGVCMTLARKPHKKAT